MWQIPVCRLPKVWYITGALTDCPLCQTFGAAGFFI